MLKELSCDYFIESPLYFKRGLNTVLGDNYSTNSIGKSTFLMIIDFIFGGNSYMEKDSGTIKELGNHSFNFKFTFQNEDYYFSRSTENHRVVNECDKDYNILYETATHTYVNKLKKLYSIENLLTFRSMVNPFSRIWGKGNYDVDKPIQNHIKKSESDSIDNLIKLFNLFESIEETKNKIKSEEESKKILSGLHKKKYVQKITKSEFEKNQQEIKRIEKEIKTIQDNLLKFTLNIEELSSKELINLKTEKKKLLRSQSLILNKLQRIELNIENKSTKSRYFRRLSEFFENPNEDKIEEIENFHSKISTILARELNATKKILQEENEFYIKEISLLDSKIDGLLKNVKSPKFIVEKIYDLTIESNKLQNLNKFYNEKNEVVEKIRMLGENLDENINLILKQIEIKINQELISINKKIHTEKKKIPSIKLNKSSYTFDHSSNTGTGKSFADLIEFDLAILKLTDLPFLIHDSVLFKNIEDQAIDKIIEQYSNFKKQIFIALDGINKFNDQSQTRLVENNVIQLSESRKLFNKDWR